MRTRSHNNPFTAVFSAVLDQFSEREARIELKVEDRLEGKTCLVTGSNTGLGKATAIELARRGARVLMACRSGIPETGDQVRKASGSPLVEMLAVDLSDLDSIHSLCNVLRDRGEGIDVLVCNAGVMPRGTRINRHGLELMFAVNFFAKFVMIKRLLEDKVLRSKGEDKARIILVSSETHRSGAPVDFERFGEPANYGVTNGVQYYGQSKFLLTTFAMELARRLSQQAQDKVSVFALCPGGVNSELARDAPVLFKPLLKPVMAALFQSPEDACVPVVYLAASKEVEGETGLYLHMRKRKEPAELALDARTGALLWEKSESLLSRLSSN